jgi:hypothetical protein
MPQKRGEIIEQVESGKIPDIYEEWLKDQVDAISDGEEDKVDRAEDLHEKAHRRKRGKTSH